MPDIDALPIFMQMYDSVPHGNAHIKNVKAALGRTWKHSVRSVGGYWTATAEWKGTRDEMLEMFQEGLMREIRTSVGSLITWQGFVAEMRLTFDGLDYERKWADIANRVKVIYTRIGDNEFTNGSAESGAWAAYNTPSTIEQSTTWATDGTYSCHIVADSVSDGGIIQTGITIVASQQYICRVSTKIVSGAWTLEIYRTDTGAVIVSATETTAGQQVIRCSISELNEYAGNIGVRISCDDASGEIYADGAVFQEGPVRAETNWYADTASQVEYGLMEEILLEPGMSDASADALAQTELAKRAWSTPTPPNDFRVQELTPNQDRLQLTFYGNVFFLRNEFSLVTGTAAANTQVSSLITAANDISAGVIETNNMTYKIDDRAPLRIWEVLRDLTIAGDASGNRWTCGVYASRVFNYQQAPTTLEYHFRAGRLLSIAGGEIEPWFAAPGLMRIDDMPLGPGSITGSEFDDSRVFFIEEVTFSVADWLNNSGGLSFKREAAGRR